MVNTIHMVVGLITGLNVLKKLTPSSCVKPLATSLALYLSMVPSPFFFILKIHLQPTILA
jgi:hypothetical protein